MTRTENWQIFEWQIQRYDDFKSHTISFPRKWMEKHCSELPFQLSMQTAYSHCFTVSRAWPPFRKALRKVRNFEKSFSKIELINETQDVTHTLMFTHAHTHAHTQSHIDSHVNITLRYVSFQHIHRGWYCATRLWVQWGSQTFSKNSTSHKTWTFHCTAKGLHCGFCTLKMISPCSFVK